MNKTRMMIIITIAGFVALTVAGLFCWWYITERNVITIDNGQTVNSGDIQSKPVSKPDFAPSHTPQKHSDASSALPGMPDDYVLSSEQLAMKEQQAKDGIWERIKAMRPGIDYVENEFVFLAPDEDEAALIAAAYGGILDSYEYGIARAHLSENSGLTLIDVLIASADTTNNMPPVDLNTIYQTN